MKNNSERDPQFVARIMDQYSSMLENEVEVDKTQISSLVCNPDLRVAVYIRTKSRGYSSFTAELFWREWKKRIERLWKYAGAYVDAADTTFARDKLMEDCRKGKIDLVLVKEISKLDYDVKTALSIIMELAYLQPAVGIYFTAENLYTLNPRINSLFWKLALLAGVESVLREVYGTPPGMDEEEEQQPEEGGDQLGQEPV